MQHSNVVQQVTSALKIGVLLVLVAGCFWAKPVVELPATAPAPASLGGVSGGALVVAVFKALQLILGTYDGWTSVSFFAEEDHNPGRNIPRSYFVGVLAVMGLYVLLNAALLYVLPLAAIAHSPVAASVAVAAAFGSWGAPLFTAISAVVSFFFLKETAGKALREV